MVTKFIRGCTYRHDTSGDLDILVVSVQYYDDKRTKLKVKWINKKTGKPVYFPGGHIDGTDRIEIQAHDYKYWSRL